MSYGPSFIDLFRRSVDYVDRILRGAKPQAAFAEAAIDEVVNLLGSDYRKKLRLASLSRWEMDEYATGSYSHALPGHAGDRAKLATPFEGRIFFAGEATHPHFFSTCHGALESGMRAAREVVKARRR